MREMAHSIRLEKLYYIRELKSFSIFVSDYNLFTQRRASKAFYRSLKTTFLAYFHVFAGNHQWTWKKNH